MAMGHGAKKPYRRTHATPYDRPPTAFRNASSNSSWLSKFVNPAQSLIASGARKIFSSVFRKCVPPPPHPISSPAPAPSTSQKPPAPNSASQELNLEESRKHEKAVVAFEGDKQERAIGQIKCQTSSDGSYFMEIEQLLKQRTFTRSEISSLKVLVHSRTVEACAGNVVKMQGDSSLRTDLFDERKVKLPNITGLENGVQNHPVPCQITGSMSAVPWLLNVENGLTSVIYQARSAQYKMARTPHSRVQLSSSLKGDAYSGTSASRQGAQKRKYSFLEYDIGSVGPARRIRRKPYLLSSRGLISQASGSPRSMTGSRSGTDSTQSPSLRQPVVHNEAKGARHTKMSTEKVDDTNGIPITSFPLPTRKSREGAAKIL